MKGHRVVITMLGILFFVSCSEDNIQDINDSNDTNDILKMDIFTHDVIFDAVLLDGNISPDAEVVTDTGLCEKECPKNMHCVNNECICDEGFGDCNYDLSDGCEADLLNDNKNCGLCVISCEGPKLGAISYKCERGECVVEECADGRADCDKRGNNGCEVYLNDDKSNCGYCGFDCGANSKCVSAKCDCQKGFANCNHLLDDGCEVDIMSDSENCGMCKNSCKSHSFCNAGICSCEKYYGDCNNDRSDGCETYLKDNLINCGSCWNNCTKLDNVMNVTCQVDVCIILSCKPGYADCDGNPVNGCEAKLSEDIRNCGACDKNCGDNSVCDGGICKCKSGFADCNNLLKDGCEINLNNDDINCGSCGNICGYASNCSKGICTCQDGYADCNKNSKDGCEVYLKNDNRNCGVCSNNCGYEMYCENNNCIPCENFFGNCNEKPSDRCESNLLTDNNNCGNCGNKCNQKAYCEGGKCKCEAGYWNCNNDWSDGCEVNLTNDDNNCGNCGMRCGFMAYCEKSLCNCYTNYGNCNGNWGDGCETDLRTSNNHCGSCENSCKANSQCVGGVCECNYGYADCNQNLLDGCEANLLTDKNNCGICSNRCYNVNSYYGNCMSGVCNGLLQWGKSFGGEYDDTVQKVLVDSQDNVVIIGNFNSEKINFGGGDLFRGSSASKGFVAKFDKDGNNLWSMAIEGFLKTAGVFSNGDILLGGEFSGIINISGNQLVSKGGSDIYFVKLSSTGGFNWVKTFGGNKDDKLFLISISPSNEIVISGEFDSDYINLGGDNLIGNTFFAKFNNNMTHIWSKSYSLLKINSVDYVSSNIYVAGVFDGYTNIGCSNFSNKGGSDVFFAKMNEYGDCVSSYSFGGNNNEKVVSLLIDSNKYIYLIGSYSSGVIDFGGGKKITNKGGSDIFIVGLDSNYGIVLLKSFGDYFDEEPTQAVLDYNQDLVITGYYQSNPIDFGGGNHTNSGMADAYILKLDKNGDFLFSKTFGNTEFEVGKSIGILSNNDIIFTASFGSSSVSIDSQIFKNANQYGMNLSDILLLRFGK